MNEGQTTARAISDLTMACEPDERVAFQAGFLSSITIFSRLVWARAWDEFRSTGQINNATGSLLLQSIGELRSSSDGLTHGPEGLSCASPALQEFVKNALDFNEPFYRIANEFLDCMVDMLPVNDLTN